MSLPLESVPNFSEGRDRSVIDEIAAALSGPARLLDVHSDRDHNRAVYTLAGTGSELVQALLAGVRAALAFADRLASELELPVFFYGRLSPDQREPAFYRRGGLAELEARLAAGEVVPDRGPANVHPTAGGVIVGVRRPLIAFNVNLRSRDVEVARDIARSVRERDGGFPGVRALGLDLPHAGVVQVSMNVTDWEAAALHEIVARIVEEAAARGVEVI